MEKKFYKEALKQGQKQKRRLVSQGRYPYLPVLEKMVSKERLNSGIGLGIANIPSEFFVGTKTEGRTNAFAVNFMPLLDENTEFALKWRNLCKAHLGEGIREPVKAYEYMNRYYVEEGNKRVSVLKFFGAVSIPAQVTRILPPKGEAFASGVEMVNPKAKVYLEWSCVDGVQNALARLRNQGINLISSQDLARTTGSGKTPYGLFLYDENGQTNLAMPVWHWGVYYEKLIQNYLNESISTGLYNPFMGPIYTQAGTVRNVNAEGLCYEDIITMNWLLDNVVGMIPPYDQLNEKGKATVESAGILL